LLLPVPASNFRFFPTSFSLQPANWLRTNIIMPAQGAIMIPPQLGPACKVVLRRCGGHFSLEPDHLGAEAGLFVQ